jgi:hypothetical protein
MIIAYDRWGRSGESEPLMEYFAWTVIYMYKYLQRGDKYAVLF